MEANLAGAPLQVQVGAGAEAGGQGSPSSVAPDGGVSPSPPAGLSESLPPAGALSAASCGSKQNVSLSV